MTIDENFVLPVYIDEDIINDIKELCKKTKFEIFGYLIGNVLKWKEKIYVVIEEHLFLLGAVHSNKYSTSQIEGAAGKYEKRFQQLKDKRKNENLRIVGWWHSHPNFGCFLSSTDVETQRFFFPESYQVALVVDPVRDSFNFYSLDNNSNKGYKQISCAIIISSN